MQKLNNSGGQVEEGDKEENDKIKQRKDETDSTVGTNDSDNDEFNYLLDYETDNNDGPVSNYSSTNDLAQRSRSSMSMYEVEHNAVIHEDDSDIDELAQSSAGKKAMESFIKILVESGTTDSHLPISMFDLLIDVVGEGFHGDELDKQLALVDHDGTGMITNIAFIKWYCNLVNQEVDEPSQESDVAEEKAKAEKAFDVLGNGNTEIPASYFSKLLESLGTTYCEEEHVRTMKKLSMLDRLAYKSLQKTTLLSGTLIGCLVTSIAMMVMKTMARMSTLLNQQCLWLLIIRQKVGALHSKLPRRVRGNVRCA
jgi:hypothetical protein